METKKLDKIGVFVIRFNSKDEAKFLKAPAYCKSAYHIMNVEDLKDKEFNYENICKSIYLEANDAFENIDK